MSALPNPIAAPPTDAAPSDRNVREIVAVCAKHEVACEEPASLSEFMRALHDDKHFAMDFWKVVGRLTRDNEEATPTDWLLAVVVEGVTGQTVAATRAAGPEEAAQVGKLARILAGEDDPSTPEPMLASDPIRTARAFSPREESPRLHLRPEPVASAAESQLHPQDDPQIVIPLAAYADRETKRSPAGLLFAACVLALVATGWFWAAHHRNSAEWQKVAASTHVGYASADSLWKRAFDRQPSSSAPQVSKPANSANPLATPEPLPSVPQTPPPAAQSPPSSAQPTPAQAEPPQSAAAKPALARHRHTIDPVVLEAARESQRQ